MATIPANEKVFMVDRRTNTTYGGSAALQAMQEWYTMEDVSNTVKPYKVFTALVSQEGGFQEDESDNFVLTVGVTYTISQNGEEKGDFINVGAPNNEDGTSFVATGEVPNSWGQASLFFNTGSPTVTMLENTIGNLTFEYQDEGIYGINSDSLFLKDKTWFSINGINETTDGPSYGIARKNNETIILKSSVNGVPQNDLMGGVPIEIRIYN